ELLSQPRHEYPAFAAALSLVILLPPGEVADLLRTRLARIARAIAEIRQQRDSAVAGGVHPVFPGEDDYPIALLETEASFTTPCLDKIENPENGWAGPWQAHHASQQPGEAGTQANIPTGTTGEGQ